MQHPSTTLSRAAGRGRIKIGSDAIAAMIHYRQIGPHDTEAGGLLLGRHIRDSEDIVVDIVTVPMPGDIRTRCGFMRRSRGHQEFMERVWKESNSTCTYLGEWHTHPEAFPHPSGIDRNNWQRRLIEDTYQGNGLFFVIIGLEAVRVWEAELSGAVFSTHKLADTSQVTGSLALEHWRASVL